MVTKYPSSFFFDSNGVMVCFIIVPPQLISGFPDVDWTTHGGLTIVRLTCICPVICPALAFRANTIERTPISLTIVNNLVLQGEVVYFILIITSIIIFLTPLINTKSINKKPPSKVAFIFNRITFFTQLISIYEIKVIPASITLV